MEIIKGVIPCAKKVVVYGPEGIGKSTFASKFPDPVFIDTEGSTNSMDVARLPKATSWQNLLDQVDYIRTCVKRLWLIRSTGRSLCASSLSAISIGSLELRISGMETAIPT